jgi:hypothetical protein
LLSGLIYADISNNISSESCIPKNDFNLSCIKYSDFKNCFHGEVKSHKTEQSSSTKLTCEKCENIQKELNLKIACLEKNYPEKEKELNILKETLLNNALNYQNYYNTLLYFISAISVIFTILGGAFGFWSKNEIKTVKKAYEEELNHIKTTFEELDNSSNSSVTLSRLNFLQMKQEMEESRKNFEQHKKDELKNLKVHYQNIIKTLQEETNKVRNTINEVDNVSKKNLESQRELVTIVDQYANLNDTIKEMVEQYIFEDNHLHDLLKSIINDSLENNDGLFMREKFIEKIIIELGIDKRIKSIIEDMDK